tara:strand:- start:116 stop:865 length:750 start_codon:yes stop_codon:yes gene_type:complete
MSRHVSRKRWGQNFLIDSNIIDKIANSINVSSVDRIMEIGPGKGAITMPLAKKVASITGIEIDSQLCDILEKQNISNLKILNNDFLKIDLDKLDINIIVGNLPYYITTPILFKIFKSKMRWEKAFFLMQKEVAERITGTPSTKSYGRLTIMSQIFSNPKILFNISPNVFRPIPKVESSFVEFSKSINYKINDYQRFEEIIRKIFNQRRKKLRNCINSEMNLNINGSTELLDKRPGDITIEEYVKLINVK